MIPSDLAARLRLLSESLVNPVAPVRGIPDELPELPIGQRFTARIESAQPDGTFRAIVAGRSLSLALPQPAQAGDNLELVVTGRTPRLVAAQPAGAAAATPPALVVGQRFLARIEASLPDGSYRAQVAGSALTLALPDAAQPGESLELVVTALAPRLVSAQRADIAAAGRAVLSPTGQLLGALLSNTGQPPQAPTLAAAAPLLPQAPAETATLTQALKQTLAESGLFYEAHLAQWLAGRHSLEALRREPQARLARATPTESGAAAAPPATDTVSGAEAAMARGVGAPGGLAAELQTLVQQQLDAAATQQIVWRGELWPGQALQWEIAAEERPGGQPGEEAAPEWRTTLRLALPHLGAVAAELRLSGEKVGLAMTADPARIGELRQGLGELAAAFAAAGLPPLAARVEAHEPA